MRTLKVFLFVEDLTPELLEAVRHRNGLKGQISGEEGGLGQGI